jgi:hypothetical protein
MRLHESIHGKASRRTPREATKDNQPCSKILAGNAARDSKKVIQKIKPKVGQRVVK